MSKGLTVVFEWQRIRLRVFRRFFYPISLEGEDQFLYSDTGREREINYRHPEDYGLETPFDRINMVRLAGAMDPLAVETKWVPFDPARLDSLDERIEKLRKRRVGKKDEKCLIYDMVQVVDEGHQVRG
jgi:hypothetical protein